MIATDILSESDGSSGIVVFSLPFLVVCTFLNMKKQHKQEFALCVFSAVYILCVAGLIFSLTTDLDEIITIVGQKTNENGRSKLYKKAMELFAANPLLGIGIGFVDQSIYQPTADIFNFHSTFFHVAATMGIFGLIAYTFYFVFRFRIILDGASPFNMFVFFSFVLFEAYGLIDVCEFNVIPLMSYITVLMAITELENVKAEDKRLPLCCNYRNQSFSLLSL